MQKIYFEKMVDLNHQLKELLSISVDESIHYKIEDQGMKAQGSIEITGEFLKSTSKERFNESIEIDLLAPFDKISEQRDFNVKIEDFDYKILDGNLMVTIQANVYGVITSEDKHIDTANERSKDKEDDLDLIEEIKEVIENHHDHIDDKTDDNDDDKYEIDDDQDDNDAFDNQDDDNDNDDYSLDDLIEISDNKDLVPYYIYVVGPNDSYDTIATRYNVPVDMIQEYNRGKEITEGCLVVIPYYES